MGREYETLAQYDAEVLVIGPRGKGAATLAAEKLGAPFPVVADPTRGVYRAYGFTKSLWVIQQSGVVLVDREGVIRHLHRSTNPSHSLDEEALMRDLEATHAGRG